MIKVLRHGGPIEMGAMVGIDPGSDGLARAARLGVPTTAEGLEGLLRLPGFKDIGLVFDATSAGAHHRHAARLAELGVPMIDLTPAAIGPYVVPVVNGEAHRGARNINMVTCGGQATIPIVAAVSQVARVHYAEIVASIASRSAGPGTRANIDEFTETTSRAIEAVGGVERGKAIIILNPAEPPLMMRDTVFTFSAPASESEVEASIEAMVAKVQAYVSGYRLKQRVQFEHTEVALPGAGRVRGLKTTVLLEVRGAAHYLPEYAGNLDIMTSAALACAQAQAAALIAA
ncbi:MULTISPECIES: acetaldehyde dehydrogenase (acetylating) [Ralstonia solanacearum species complex]